MVQPEKASWFVSQGEMVDTISYYDIEAQAWNGHPKLLQESIDNPYITFSDAYTLYLYNGGEITTIGR